MATKLEKLQELILLHNEGLTKKDFLASFQSVIDHILKLERELNQKIENKTLNAEQELATLNLSFKEAINNAILESERVASDNKSNLSNIRKWALEKVGELFIKSSINTALNDKVLEVDKRLVQVDKRIQEVNDFKQPDTSTVALEASTIALESILPSIPTVEQVVDKVGQNLPQLGEKTRDGLELLPDGEKLKIDAIQDLREELNKLEKRIVAGKTMLVPSGGGGGGHTMYVHDLSSQLNGVLKTFSLPAFWRVISIQSSSFPNAFRPTVDYTTDAGASTITFTSEIDAAGTLATGQTLIVTYAN